MALRSALGQLDVTFRGEAKGEEGEAQVDVFYASRSVPAVEVTPAPAFTLQPTATPTPTPRSIATATPTLPPAVNAVAPSPVPPSLSLGPVTLPLASLGGLLLAALIVVVVGVLTLRPPWARRR